jgi:DNA-binding CsgD family transcriptional regulator
MSDPIAILENAYAMHGPEKEWLSGLVEAVRPSAESAHGVHGWTYDASGPDFHEVRATASSGGDSGFVAANSKFDADLPIPVRKLISRIYRQGFVGNLARAPDVLRRAGLDEQGARHFGRALEGLLAEWKLADSLWVNAQDPTYLGCLLVFPLRKRGAPHPRLVNRWRYIAAHVATAFRIRRQFDHVSTSAGDRKPPVPEAVLSPNGKLEHAEEPAKGDFARAALSRAVRSLDRARGAMRRHDPEEAIAAWHALVAGRWSLIDHADSDGRRFIVAHRNDARVPDMRGFTLRERQVLAYAALGHSNKVIAYELGLSVSTVAGHLAKARAKATLPSSVAIAGSGDTRPNSSRT